MTLGIPACRVPILRDACASNRGPFGGTSMQPHQPFRSPPGVNMLSREHLINLIVGSGQSATKPCPSAAQKRVGQA